MILLKNPTFFNADSEIGRFCYPLLMGMGLQPGNPEANGQKHN